ncbi:allophanate hydrolase [Alteromonas sp. KUL42]|uniref:5-oxoprolinase subunit C family protein n=1 Tax=Alteromonas sp. KUL42 TaxID=2480797 RepID=UPI001036EE73|nr:biotin-dependent carboxyltransferase family protein [Alteromonas sp. KUL42]TAP36740.1 biotin-dependent carboxyltransferase [Alteromonas sp. KUL42]GEA06962.1 allophanate hydrolase [Alteromonas sp. KUL42]
MKIEIKNKGLLSLVVDGGRQGRQREGFCQSGPMDTEAYSWANFLAFNLDNTPCIEAIGEVTLDVDSPCVIAVTGRNVTLTVNGIEQPTYASVRVNACDEIKFGSQTLGSKSYLAIGGGWNVPLVAGSACTVMREKLGGLTNDGRPLTFGDHIEISANNVVNVKGVTRERVLPKAFQPDYQRDKPISVIPGYQFEAFSRAAQQLFVSSRYTVSSSIDRMGYRLEGPGVSSTITAMRSEAIHTGAIQIPPDGQPIVMMRDRQTLGGYPKLGCVSPVDLNRLAQAVPGEHIHFTFQDHEAARADMLLSINRLRTLQGNLL